LYFERITASTATKAVTLASGTLSVAAGAAVAIAFGATALIGHLWAKLTRNDANEQTRQLFIAKLLCVA